MPFFTKHSLSTFSSQKKEQLLADPLGALFFSLKEISQEDKHVFVIAEDNNQAIKINESLSSLYNNVLFFPNIEVLPFSHGIPSLDTLTERIRILSLLREDKQAYIIICSYPSFLRYLPPTKSFDECFFQLKNNQSISVDNIASILERYAFSQSSVVREVGEYAIKNQIIDLYPAHEERPIRIIVENKRIARIAYFDINTQLSQDSISEFYLSPLAEFLFPKDVAGFEDPFQNSLAHSNFINYYHTLSSLTEYAKRNYSLFFTSRPEITDNKLRAIYSRLGASDLLIPSIKEITQKSDQVFIHDPNGEKNSQIKLSGNFSGGFSGFVIELEKLREKNPNITIGFFSEYKENARRIAIMLRRFHPKIVKNCEEITEPGFYIITQNWEYSFLSEIPNQEFIFIGESDISGKKKAFRKRLQQTIYSNFETDIQPGDPVVHLNYGIGIFRGIQRITSLNKEKDYILIEYANEQKLFVPLEQADLIGRYSGGLENKKTKIDSLSGKSWQKKKTKAQEDIILFAKQLVEAHAKRVSFDGTSFPPDAEEQKIFEDEFQYIETPDQITSIEEIKSDMEDPKPMDRLLCGDVGFGKTEIAFRAIFKAIYANKQAAFLAPTTILAEQHYLSALERFKNFPIKIAFITRFTTHEDRADIIKKLKSQEIDFVIGTHAILNKDLKFKDLGILVIDEEHKFGVAQKEKIKKLHPLTDILALSATPIPRTLSLALGNLRSFSTIQTPPEMRIPVETIVSDFRDEVVADAIRSELERGGQVYFIHNRIKELDKFSDKISELVPESSIVIAHGQMDEDQLEDAFLGFMRGYYNVLIATTIVESGLDIPNANTLIVSDAHRLGLSQLYQLKGRVGRSRQQAFAYFLFPEHKNITETATKRLDALAEYTELGAGFHIAKKDMEIRGAGNILGSEQHGHLIAIGYDMYLKLLREEVERLQGKESDETESLIDLSYDAFIPETFINDPTLKMEIYKKILSLKNDNASQQLKKELRDRFGILPSELETLFEIARLKYIAGKIGISSITEKSKSIEIIFSKNSKADPLKILKITKEGLHPISFNPFQPNILHYTTFESNAEQKVRKLVQFLREIRD